MAEERVQNNKHGSVGGSAKVQSKPKEASETANAGAVWAPGGDSRPDMIDPAGAEFVSITDSPMMTTIRDPASMPPIKRADADVDTQKRSEDNLEIILGPKAE